ncbi:MAG: TetR/AcrR family transcriptional regulator [Flavobacteriales bacterium]|nr:TetR/AcrR family transcriptional regulator [Flavobacteriales bacterium]
MTKTPVTARQLEIIVAAGRILTTAGISGLTIKNMAAEMGFSESALYRHFSSKEDIIIAMLSYLAKTMDTEYEKALRNITTPQDRFAALFNAQFKFFSQHPYFVVAVFSDGLLKESNRINETIFQIMMVHMKNLMPIIIQGQQQSLFTNAIPAEDILHIVMGAIRLQMLKWNMANFESDLVHQGNHIIHSLLTVLKGK